LKAKAICLALALVALLAFPVASKAVVDPSYIGLDFSEGVEFPEPSLFSALVPEPAKPGYLNTILCNGANDPSCSTAPSFQIISLLPVCANGTYIQCVNAPEINLDNTGYQTANFEQDAGKLVFPEYRKAQIPAGGSVSLWSVKAADGSKTYFALVPKIIMNLAAATVAGLSTSSSDEYLSDINLIPVTLNPDPGSSYYYGVNTDPGGGTGLAMLGGPTNPKGENCIFLYNNNCGVAKDLNFSARLSLNVTDRIGSWFHGRLNNGTITSTNSHGIDSIVLQGDSLEVPIVHDISLPGNEGKIQAFYSPSELASQSALTPVPITDTTTQAPWSDAFEWQNGNTFDTFLYNLPYFGYKATGVISEWAVRSDSKESGYCLKQKIPVQGMLSTNATVYQASPPAYQDGDFSYQVAATPQLPDGTPFIGTYDLNVNKQVAQCLYPEIGNNAKAEINLTDSDGSTQAVTSSISTNKNWFNFDVSGFHFSSPNIQVKLLPTVEPAKLSPPTKPKSKKN
jgi:hypothetical protein